MPREVNVVGLVIDPVGQTPIVVLRDREGNTIPIWIGVLEANAIVVALEKIAMPRPMTHDLFKDVLEQTGGKLLRLEVTDLREGTYYAALHIEHGGKTFVVDSRPSDGIAIALRMKAPIMVRDEVLAKAKSAQEGAAGTGKDKWTELLEKMDPEDFSKYKM